MVAAAPLVRPVINRGGHQWRLRLIRRLVPGNTLQVTDELVGFAELADQRNPRAVCEIGTYKGGTSLFLCGLGSVRRFVGLDIKTQNVPLIRALAPRHVDVTILEGPSDELRHQINGQFDILFIDGDHSYEGVQADFLAYRDVVRPGGLIAFHDINPAPHEPTWSGGVPQLWREVRDGYRHWEFVANPGEGYGIGVLEAPSR